MYTLKPKAVFSSTCSNTVHQYTPCNWHMTSVSSIYTHRGIFSFRFDSLDFSTFSGLNISPNELSIFLFYSPARSRLYNELLNRNGFRVAWSWKQLGSVSREIFTSLADIPHASTQHGFIYCECSKSLRNLSQGFADQKKVYETRQSETFWTVDFSFSLLHACVEKSVEKFRVIVLHKVENFRPVAKLHESLTAISRRAHDPM